MCIIEINSINQMFSRVPQQVVGLVQEKTHSFAVTRRDKSLGETVKQFFLGFFDFMSEKMEVSLK
jgi:hypothetical protein